MYGKRFKFFSPRLWNCLSLAVRTAESLDSYLTKEIFSSMTIIFLVSPLSPSALTGPLVDGLCWRPLKATGTMVCYGEFQTFHVSNICWVYLKGIHPFARILSTQHDPFLLNDGKCFWLFNAHMLFRHLFECDCWQLSDINV